MEAQHLLAQLEALPAQGQTAFAALCCERLIPNYQAFQVNEQWGDVSALTIALDAVWEYISGTSMDSNYVLELQAACKLVAPDTEDFTSLYAELGLTTASAVYMLLQTVLDANAQTAIRVAELAFTAVDEYLNRVADPLLTVHGSSNTFDEWLRKAPMFESERIMQQENIGTAHIISSLSYDEIVRLRNIERTRGIQPFLRGLVKEPGIV